jgi:cobalt/nickel transport protein
MRMAAKKDFSRFTAGISFAVWAVAGTAYAHFLVLMPGDDIVSAEDSRAVGIQIEFTHPMEQGPVMEMGKPAAFGVMAQGRKTDLLGQLQQVIKQGATAYRAQAELDRPADYVFYLEPMPYWEPAEQKMIVHYTKVVVDYLDAQDGWDEMVGFPVEIEPLVRPYGLWTGNLFRGVVRRDGEPVPYAEVEVEYYNEGGAVQVPDDPFITQVIKADANGVFSYAMPRAGWWGFAALVEGDRKLVNPDGQEVDVELGGLLWIRAVDME